MKKNYSNMNLKKSILLVILFCITLSSAFAQGWTALSGPTGGNIEEVTMDSNGRLYVLLADGGDIFASSNGGTTWANLTSSIDYIHGVVVDGSTLYASTWSQIYSSTNGGVNWTKVNQTSNLSYLDRGMILFKVGTKTALFAYGTEGGWISLDAGANWKKVYDKRIERMSNVSYSSAGDLYIAAPTVGILKHPTQANLSDWDLSKWQVIYPKENASDDYSLSVGVNQNNADKVFISYKNAAGSATILKTSINGGSTFPTTMTTPELGSNDSQYWFSFPGKFYYVFGSSLFQVNDGATPQTTKKAKSGYSFYNIRAMYYKSFSEVYVGTDGDGLWKSTDDIGTVAPTNGTMPNAITRVPLMDIEVIGNRLMAVPHSDSFGYWTSTNDGANWEWRTLPFGIQTYWNSNKVFERLQDNSIIVPSGSGTYRTTDGFNWDLRSTEVFMDYVTVGSTELYGFRTNPTSPMMKSTNGGQTWSAITLTGWPSTSWNLRGAAYDGANFYVSYNEPTKISYYKITMTSATTATATLLNTGMRSDRFPYGLFIFKGKLYIGDGDRIAISSDQGASFKYISYSHGKVFPIDQKVGAIGISNNGVLTITKDDGISFTSIALPNSEVTINNIAAPNAGAGDTYATASGSPVLKFAVGDSLVRNASTPYIDFGWTKMGGPEGGGSGRKLMKSTSGQLFVEDWGAIYRFNGTTNAWESLDNVNVNNHGSFHDGTNLYQIRWGEIFKSTDNGNTFTLRSNNQFQNSNGNGAGLFKASNGNIFVLTDGNGLYRSTNDGTSFTQYKSGRLYIDLVEGTAGVLVAVGRENGAMFLERSTDGGATWTTAQTGMTFGANQGERMLSVAPNGDIIITRNGNIYRSTDGGQNWASIKSNISETSWNDQSKTYVAPNGDYYFYLHGYPGKLYVSTNQGGTWTVKNSTLFDFIDFLWIGARIYAVGAQGAGVIFSDDGGTTFTTLASNKGLNLFRKFDGGDIRINNSRITIANNSALSTSPDGVTWSSKNTFTAGRLLDLPNGDIIAYTSGISRSTDGGLTYTDVGGYNYFPFMTYDGTKFITLGQLGGCCSQSFYTSTDLLNWTKLDVSGIPSSIGGYNSLASLGSKIFVTAYNPAIQREEAYEISSGVATLMSIVGNSNARQVISRNDKVYLLSNNGFIFETSNGTTWNKRAVPSGANKLIFANNGYLFLPGDRGLLWVSRDGGLSWQNVSATNMNAQFGDVAIDINTGIAYGTFASKPLFKSAGIVIPNDKAGPTIQSFTPANQALNVKKANLKLVVTFNEGAKPVAGKNLRIFSASNSTTPIETIAVTTGVAADNRVTYTPTFTPADLGVYYVVIDAGAFTDYYNNASAALVDPNAWRFTIEDATAPAITFTTSNIEKGSAKAFETTITDNGGIATQKIVFYHRNITSAATAPFTAVPMTAQTGGTATNSKFTTPGVNETDGMGLEFYIEAEDVAGNKSRSPATATAFHYAYITYPVANRPSLNGVVTFGGSADTYRIIAVPFKLENASISTILDELGPPDKKNWRLLTFAGSAGADVNWQEFDGQSGLTNFARGKGYWFNAKNETSLSIEGASSPENNRTSFFKLSLQPGWNQIGNPYPIAINWTEVIAGTNGIGQLKKFAGGAYANATTLNSLEGGFVFVSGSGQEVTVRFPGITTGGREEKTAIGSDLNAEAWELPLLIEQGDLKNEVSGIGMHPKANLNFDSFDDLNMPLFEGLPQAEIQFQKSAGEMKVLAKDVVPTQGEFMWQFNLVSNRGEQAVLRWNNQDLGSNTKELYLLDEGTQQLINMREETSYSFSPSQSKSFKIYFGEELRSKIKPGKIHLGKAYPNPASGNVSIPFALSDKSASHTVVLEIYNAQGGKVAVLHEGNLAPGFYTKGWDTDASHLNNGLYIVRMAVRSAEWQIVQTEKIIINN